MVPTQPARPSKDDIAQMPAFEGLPLERIHLVSSRAQIDLALHALTKARCIGFDTESKPTFRVGRVARVDHPTGYGADQPFEWRLCRSGDRQVMADWVRSPTAAL